VSIYVYNFGSGAHEKKRERSAVAVFTCFFSRTYKKQLETRQKEPLINISSRKGSKLKLCIMRKIWKPPAQHLIRANSTSPDAGAKQTAFSNIWSERLGIAEKRTVLVFFQRGRGKLTGITKFLLLFNIILSLNLKISLTWQFITSLKRKI